MLHVSRNKGENVGGKSTKLLGLVTHQRKRKKRCRQTLSTFIKYSPGYTPAQNVERVGELRKKFPRESSTRK